MIDKDKLQNTIILSHAAISANMRTIDKATKDIQKHLDRLNKAKEKLHAIVLKTELASVEKQNKIKTNKQ